MQRMLISGATQLVDTLARSGKTAMHAITLPTDIL